MNNTNFKENLKQFYNTEAELRNSKSTKSDWKYRIRDKFCDLIKLENKRTLLEIGAGAGHDSRYFMDNGLKVIAVDFTSEMVKFCHAKSIEAYELDYYNLSSLDKKFDCVYAMNTLLHVPKIDLRHVLNEIDHVLETNGFFYMGQYGGNDTESDYIKKEVSDTPRLYALYSASFLKTTLADCFDIIDYETLDVRSSDDTFTFTNTFHSIIMRKKINK